MIRLCPLPSASSRGPFQGRSRGVKFMQWPLISCNTGGGRCSAHSIASWKRSLSSTSFGCTASYCSRSKEPLTALVEQTRITPSPAASTRNPAINATTNSKGLLCCRLWACLTKSSYFAMTSGGGSAGLTERCNFRSLFLLPTPQGSEHTPQSCHSLQVQKASSPHALGHLPASSASKAGQA